MNPRSLTARTWPAHGRCSRFSRKESILLPGSDDEKGCADASSRWHRELIAGVPSAFTTNTEREYYLQLTWPACRAMSKQTVKRVVAVSAMGRRLALDGGLVPDSIAKNEDLERAGVSFRALCCPGLMENMFRPVDSLKH